MSIKNRPLLDSFLVASIRATSGVWLSKVKQSVAMRCATPARCASSFTALASLFPSEVAWFETCGVDSCRVSSLTVSFAVRGARDSRAPPLPLPSRGCLGMHHLAFWSESYHDFAPLHAARRTPASTNSLCWTSMSSSNRKSVVTILLTSAEPVSLELLPHATNASTVVPRERGGGLMRTCSLSYGYASSVLVSFVLKWR